MSDTPASLGDWLEQQLVAVPHELTVRIRGALPDEWRSISVADGPVLLTAAAVTELRDLLQRGCDTRWAAPGLLTVDALVTYACELAAVTGADLDGTTRMILDSVAEVLPQDGAAA